MDVEDVDMSTLEDILIMGLKYGDQLSEWGNIRDECRRATVYETITQESWEEIVHNSVPLDHGPEESELGGAECYDTVEDQTVIFDDEPRNPADLERHPEREAILVSAGKEIDQLIEEEIGVEVTPAEVITPVPLLSVWNPPKPDNYSTLLLESAQSTELQHRTYTKRAPFCHPPQRKYTLTELR
jgi:hypothetical protein